MLYYLDHRSYTLYIRRAHKIDPSEIGFAEFHFHLNSLCNFLQEEEMSCPAIFVYMPTTLKS
jgi:hypothetical protein